MDDVGHVERSPCSHGLSHRAGHTARSMAQTSPTPLTPCSHLPVPTLQLHRVLFANTPAPTLHSEAGGAAAHPTQQGQQLPWSLVQGHKMCKKERREHIYFLFIASRAVPVVRIRFALQPPTGVIIVSWAQDTVKKNSSENDKHYSRNICSLFLINS